MYDDISGISSFGDKKEQRYIQWVEGSFSCSSSQLLLEETHILFLGSFQRQFPKIRFNDA